MILHRNVKTAVHHSLIPPKWSQKSRELSTPAHSVKHPETVCSHDVCRAEALDSSLSDMSIRSSRWKAFIRSWPRVWLSSGPATRSVNRAGIEYISPCIDLNLSFQTPPLHTALPSLALLLSLTSPFLPLFCPVSIIFASFSLLFF